MTNEEQEMLQESLSSHAGDFDFRLQKQKLSQNSKKEDDNCSGKKELTDSNTSLSIDGSSAKTSRDLQSSSQKLNFSVTSAATTQCASNMNNELRPPMSLRQNSRRASLRLAAASIQQRGSLSSFVSPGEDVPEKQGMSSSPQSGAEALDASLACPHTEFEKLKRMNEHTVMDLNEKLNSLNLDVLEYVPNVGVADLGTETTCVENNIDVTPAKDSSLGARDTHFGHSMNGTWTSASMEFEHLKEMYDDTAADLETQLKMLELQEAELNQNEFDVSRSTLNDSSNTFGGLRNA